MSFTILACSDIRAQKVNIEFPFTAPPSSIEELRRIIEETFRGEEEAIKRANGFTDARPCEPFTINRLQKYNDDTQTWEEVTSPSMLETYDQVYVFRKNSTKADIAKERELPPPRKSPFFPYASSRGAGSTAAAAATASASPYSAPGTASFPRDFSQSQPQPYASSSPYRHPASASPGVGAGGYPGSHRGSPSRGSNIYAVSAVPPAKPDGSVLMYRERTTPERIEYLFRFADQHQRGSLEPREYETIFRAADIRFPSTVVYDLHQHFSHPVAGSEGRMSMDDFQRYASDFPVAVNIAYQRITNQEREEAMVGAQRQAAQRVDALQRQVKDLEERLAAAQRELQRQADQKARLQDGLHELYRQRDPEYCQDEQKLLDKEVSVFKYRERLSREEQDYERMAMERRRRTAQQGIGADGGPAGVNASVYDEGRYGPT